MPNENIPASLIIKDIYQTLKDGFTEYKEDGQGTNVILKQCPFCADEGWHFYLSISEDINTKTDKPKAGSYNCFKCPNGGATWEILKKQLTEDNGTVVIARPFQYKKETHNLNDRLETINKYNINLLANPTVLKYVLDRGISIDSIKQFKLGYTTMKFTELGATECLTIPHFYQHQLVNVKARTLPPARKTFRRITGCPSVLFNFDNIDHEKDYVCICEGELDAISLYQAGERNIVSITCGARSFLPDWYDMLKNFARVYLVLDNDPQGQEGAKYISQRLGQERCYNVLLPPQTKDLNAYFAEGHTLDDFMSLILEARKFTIDNIYTAASVFEEIERNIFLYGDALKGLPIPWKSMHKRTGDFVGGDLIYLSALPGQGKTSLALNLCHFYSFTMKIPTLLFCLEMKPTRLGLKLIHLHRKTTKQLMTRDDLFMTRADFEDVPFYFGYANANKLTPEILFAMIREARKKYGIEFFVFDNIHFLCRSKEYIRQEIGQLSRGFKSLAEEIDIPIMVIAHPRKLQDNKIMTANDLKESSSMYADGDFVIILHRERLNNTDLSQIHTEEELDDINLYSPLTLVIVDKARYDPGGMATLYFEGDKSYFRDPLPEELPHAH